jgi:tetratricopeptide (TPR) repeat protein
MWVERFHWWGHYGRVQDLGRRILDDPAAVSIRLGKDLDILGNVCALWARTFAILEGYSEDAVQQAEAMVNRLPSLADCTSRQALARARLLGTIGYHHQNKGLLEQAVREYAESLASFRQAGGHPDEYSMLLNNLAFVYALQGRFVQAHMLARDALRMNEQRSYDYATGLTLATLAGITLRQGNFPQAMEYGREALELFQRIDEAHGTVLAYQALAKTARWLGKHETQQGRRPEEAKKRLEEAILYLQRAQNVLQKANMEPERFLPVYGELGRAYRDMGNLLKRQGEGEEALRRYHEAQRLLEGALDEGQPLVIRASILEDVAEVQFMMGDVTKANATLEEVEQLIGPEYRILPGKQVPAKGLATEHFAPLGKAELLRGQMAFEDGRFKEGMQRYLLAHAYFKHFSAEAVELDILIDYLYAFLRELPPSDLLDLMEVVRQTVREQDFGVDVSSFAQILEDLVGI